MGLVTRQCPARKPSIFIPCRRESARSGSSSAPITASARHIRLARLCPSSKKSCWRPPGFLCVTRRRSDVREGGEERFAHLLAQPSVIKIRSALASHSPVAAEDEEGVRKAAVALIFRLGKDDALELLFIKRAEYEGDPWSGQIAFPGGRMEARDTSLRETAIRETREETGIDLAREGMVIGVLDDLRPRTVRLPAIVVRPYLALVDRDDPLRLSQEVALAFWLPFTALEQSEFWHEETVSARGIQINARVFRHQEHVIWGMTERILAQLLELL